MSWRLFIVLVLLLSINRESESQELGNGTSLPETSLFEASQFETTTIESVTVTDSTTDFSASSDSLEENEDEENKNEEDVNEEVVIEEMERPQQLEVTASTQRTITLRWKFTPTSERVIGYRIFYSQDNVPKVKAIMYQTSTYELSELDPFTTYQIWVEGIFAKSRGLPSKPILANTDVDQPSPPDLLNATCFDTGSIYVEWKRPDRYDNSVDYYKLYHKPLSDPTFKSVTIQANAKEDYLSYVIDKLLINADHVIKICAGTKSLSNPNKTWLGEPSIEKVVFLPENKCELGALAPKMSREYMSGIIAGVCCAFFLILLAVICFLTRRKRLKQQQFSVEKIQSQPVSPPEHFSWEEKFGPEWGSESIPLEIFSDHVSRLHIDSDIGFSKEYEEIQKFSKKIVKATHEHSANPENKAKNRYLNIVAYDHTRVRLLPVPGQKKSSDYINANFIDSFKQCNAYIGTQGPLENTFEAFWRMVWEQNVYVIVMITNLIEKSRKKCDRYWPSVDCETYGMFEASLAKEEVMANYTVRTLKLKHTKLKGAPSHREVKQFHYTSWPDHGVPSHPLPVLTYIRKSLDANPADGGPVIVHCSAGVGRTGTYITIDSMLQQIQFKNELNVFGFLKHIRGQRNHLVQTEEQYVFIHDALLEAIQSGNTEVHRDQIADNIEKLVISTRNADQDQDENDIERLVDKQFKLAISYKPPEFLRMSAKAKYNVEKNRNPDLVPVDSSRIVLAPKPGVEGSDYINASWFHGHHKLNEFIVTQHPQEKEKEDFWRMLWDHSAQTVVLFSPTDEKEFPRFWPLKDSDLNFETFRVRFVDESVHAGHTTLDFAVSSNHDDFGLAVRIIYSPEWPGCIANLEDVFSVLKVVQDWHLEYQNGPLVVVDKFGGTEAATFCSLTTFCKELESFNSFDVYQVAKLYHNKRPGIWKSSKDLLYLYSAMEALIVSKRLNPLHDSSAPTSGVATSVDLSPSSNATADVGMHWPNGRLVKKSLSGHGLESSAATSTTNTTDEEVCNIMTRRYSFPADFKNPVTNGCAITIPNEEEELTENLAQKSPLLKANSNGV